MATGKRIDLGSVEVRATDLLYQLIEIRSLASFLQSQIQLNPNSSSISSTRQQFLVKFDILSKYYSVLSEEVQRSNEEYSLESVLLEPRVDPNTHIAHHSTPDLLRTRLDPTLDVKQQALADSYPTNEKSTLASARVAAWNGFIEDAFEQLQELLEQLNTSSILNASVNSIPIHIDARKVFLALDKGDGL
uniref:Uncharacterized protein n=1 Tax=Timspurckia oligopyrenoides TaxID=708627 RepID=A0A7S0ZBL4_9RHOD|mmetsp:Transcript_1143/g.2135  ORF Transcript_1143/g.2135 Transcript_1143/m.2135 type:complete len:190 (+) Transcript_1143:119-688(+)